MHDSPESGAYLERSQRLLEHSWERPLEDRESVVLRQNVRLAAPTTESSAHRVHDSVDERVEDNKEEDWCWSRRHFSAAGSKDYSDVLACHRIPLYMANIAPA